MIAKVRLWGRTIGAVSLDEGREVAAFQYDAKGSVRAYVQLNRYTARTDLLRVARLQVAPPLTPWSLISVLERHLWRFKRYLLKRHKWRLN